MSRQDGGEKKGGNSQKGKPLPKGVTVSGDGKNIVITGSGGETVITSSRGGISTTQTYIHDADSSDSDSSSDSDEGTVLHTFYGGAVGNIQAGNITATHVRNAGASQHKKQSQREQPQQDCFPKDFKAWLKEHEVKDETVALLARDGFDSFKTFACIEDRDIVDLGLVKGQQRLLQHLSAEARQMKKGGRHVAGVDLDSGGDVAMVRIEGAGSGNKVQTSHFSAPVVAGVIGNVSGKIGNIMVSSSVNKGASSFADALKGSSRTKIWQGALSDDTLSHLSTNLSDEWQHVMVHLGLPHPSVKQAQSDHRVTSQCILTLLHRWRDSCEEPEESMVEKLLTSLRKEGRNDLSHDVQNRHLHSQESAPPPPPGHSEPYQSAQASLPQDFIQPVHPSQHDPSPDLSLHPNLQLQTAMAEREPMDQDGP